MTEINRRTFIKVGAMTAIAACAPGSEETTTTTAAAGGTTATTAAAGATTTVAPAEGTTRLVFGVRPPPLESNNTAREVGGAEEFQLKPLYENLIGADPETGAWIPMLAESWQLEPNGTSVRFFLRQGVQFHNDIGEFTAQDVFFTYDNLVNPEGAIQNNASAMRDIVEEVEIVNDYEIIFHNNDASYSFFELLGYGAGGMGIISKADFDARGGHPPITEAPLAGTGPFQFVSRAPAENVIFQKVPFEHWRKNAGFEEMEFRYIGEDSSRLAALVAGEVHVTDLPADLAAEAVAQGAEEIVSAVPGRRMHMNFLGAYVVDPFSDSDEKLYPDSPMNDRRVRIAINKAVDREAINQAFFAGRAEHIAMSYWPPELPGYSEEWEAKYEELYAYDPDGARALLAEAGFAEGELTVECIATDHGGSEGPDVVEAVANMLTDIGINAPIIAIDSAQHRERRMNLEYECALEFDSDSSEPITAFIAQGIGRRESGRGRGPEFLDIDELYFQTITELDPEAQAELWKQLGDLAVEYVQHIPIGRIANSFVVDPTVVGSYTFPGAMTTPSYTHFEYIEPA